MNPRDGMLFANALRFVPKPDAVLGRLITWLRSGRKPSRWVRFPIDVHGLEYWAKGSH